MPLIGLLGHNVFKFKVSTYTKTCNKFIVQAYVVFGILNVSNVNMKIRLIFAPDHSCIKYSHHSFNNNLLVYRFNVKTCPARRLRV